MQLREVYLYPEPAVPSLNVASLARYLVGLLPSLRIEVRKEFVTWHLERAGDREKALTTLPEQLARCRVRVTSGKGRDVPPLPGEIAYERRRLTNSEQAAFGILYDGVRLMALYRTLLPRGESSLKSLHVMFTQRLIGTPEEYDGRYHARVVVLGFPCLLSTSGLVEAPAKPREYYLLRQQYAALGMPDAAAVILDKELGGRVLRQGDPRLTEAMKGYVLQALMYHVDGSPFCDDPGCRLYNAHWQEEVIRAQINSGYEFCPVHRQRLEELRLLS